MFNLNIILNLLTCASVPRHNFSDLCSYFTNNSSELAPFPRVPSFAPIRELLYSFWSLSPFFYFFFVTLSISPLFHAPFIQGVLSRLIYL